MADPIDTFVGARIKLARRQTGTSQEDLAAALGITFQQVQKYERGFNRISASRLAYTAAKLRKPVAWFFEGIEVAAGDAALADAAGLQAALVHAHVLVPRIAAIPDLTPVQRAALAAMLDAFAPEPANPPKPYTRAPLALGEVAGHG